MQNKESLIIDLVRRDIIKNIRNWIRRIIRNGIRRVIRDLITIRGVSRNMERIYKLLIL